MLETSILGFERLPLKSRDEVVIRVVVVTLLGVGYGLLGRAQCDIGTC